MDFPISNSLCKAVIHLLASSRASLKAPMITYYFNFRSCQIKKTRPCLKWKEIKQKNLVKFNKCKFFLKSALEFKIGFTYPIWRSRSWSSFWRRGSAAWKCWLHRKSYLLRSYIAKSKELLKSNFFELVRCMSFDNLVWFVFNHVNLPVAFLSSTLIYNVTLQL